MCVLEIIVGILLLIDPNTFTTGIVTVCGVFLLVDVVALLLSGAKKKAADQTPGAEVEGEAV